MGRIRPSKGATKAATSSLDKKPIAKPAREKAANKSYAEDSGSDVELDKLDAGSPSPSPAAAVEKDQQEDNSSEDEVLATTKAKAAPAKRGAPAATASKNNSNANARAPRAAIKQSYKVDNDSEEDEVSEGKPSSPEITFSDVEDDDDDDDFVAESSGSEYGKKKRKPAAKAKKGSPAKGRGAKRGRKKAGSGSATKRGRKPATPSSSARSGKNGAAARGKKRAAADSDEEEEMSNDNGSESEEEYVAKASSSRGTKRVAVSSGRGGRKAAAVKPAPKKLNLDLSDEDEEPGRGQGADGESDDEDFDVKPAATKRGAPAAAKKSGSAKKQPTPRAAPTPSRASARKPPANKKISYAEIDNEEDEEDEEAVVVPKPGSKSKREPPARKTSVEKKPAEEPMDVDEEEEEEEKLFKERKPAAAESSASSEADVDEADADAKEVKEEKPAAEAKVSKVTTEEKAKAKANGNGNAKAEDDAEDEDQGQEDQDSDEVASNGNGTTAAAAAVLKNRTETDWDALDFSCDKKTEKTGEPWNLKLASWNVGGVKAWLGKNGLRYLEKEAPDVFCMQEIRCSEKTRPEGLAKVAGYPYCYWLHSEGTGGHHGVATFCKTEPLSIAYGLPIHDDDNEKEKKLKRMFNGEGRLISTEFDKFYLLNTYIPNSGRGVTDDEHKAPYPARICNGERQAWDKFFMKYVQELQAMKPVIVTGDLNVAHEAIDLANPGTNKRTAGYTVEERDAFSELLDETGLCDSFRYMNPQKEGAYSFWSYRLNAREKNVGWRLDYFLVSPQIREGLCESLMRSEVYGSDHCPIVVWARV